MFMPNSEKVFVSIYCKVFDDVFSDEMRNRVVTGNNICEFLMKDAQLCLDENGNPIPGDCNLWYLGCTDNSGQIRYSQKLWRWKKGESSFDTVEDFVSSLYVDNLITKQQFEILKDKIMEGRCMGNVSDIRIYLSGNRREYAAGL
jgi:hypothetical protein